jgi:membrane fusion protein (multidrug efflux system)
MNASAPAADGLASGTSRRRQRLLLLAVIVLVAVLSFAAYWWMHGRWFAVTDNAYVGGRIVQITAEIPGTIRTIYPQETDTVAAGQPLVLLDPVDAQVAFDTALADLGATARQVRGYFAQVERARAQLRSREAELRRLRADVARRTGIAGSGAVSVEELAHLREAVDVAVAAERAAREELNAALTQTRGTSVERHPQVERAAMRVRDAALALSRTTIAAPLAGVVGKKGVQVGQRVAPGTPLMAVVPLDGVWVDANFKEVQLEGMRIGQPVALRADLYGRDVTFHGRIQGFSPGTGAAFALLPPQNASGNWIKIVQRVPVRITLDPEEVRAHPLLVGLSMRAEVDLHDRSGPVLTEPTTAVAGTMPTHAERDPEVEATIARIIAENGA